MTALRLPYFMGERLDGLAVPGPFRDLVPTLPLADPRQRMGALYRHLAERVTALESPVVWAGDCVVILGVLAGLQQRGIDPTLVFFDAHGDFNTWETTPSGFLGGMPLAMATGRGDQTIVEALGLQPMDDRGVVLVDGRHLDPRERDAVASSGIRHLSMSDLADVAYEGPLYVHIDVDVVDPEDMPAVNYPAPGGRRLDDVVDALATLSVGGGIMAVSLSAWTPALPGANIAAAAGARLVGAVSGG